MNILPNETASPKLISIVKCIVYWVLFIFLLFLVGNLLSPLFHNRWERFVYGVFGTLSAFFATWLFVKNENKSFTDYGLTWQKNTLSIFLKGFALGTAIFILIILILVSFSELHIERNPKAWNPLSAFWFLSIIPLVLMEEITFRSYPFLKLN